MTPELYAACAKAIHVVRGDGTVLRAGRAALFIVERLGWGRLARALGLPPFIWLVEFGYHLVARNRVLFSKVMFRPEKKPPALDKGTKD